MSPSKEKRSGLGAQDRKKHSHKHHIFAPTAGAHCTIFPKLCIVVEFVDTIKKGGIIFRSNA